MPVDDASSASLGPVPPGPWRMKPPGTGSKSCPQQTWIADPDLWLVHHNKQSNCSVCNDYIAHYERHCDHCDGSLESSLEELKNNWYDAALRHPNIHFQYALAYPDKVAPWSEDGGDTLQKLEASMKNCEELHKHLLKAQDEIFRLKEENLHERETRLKAQVQAAKVNLTITSTSMAIANEPSTSTAVLPQLPPMSWADQVE
ncbi:hypothetical protein FRC17_010119 [Serendipita sp. 399]|nr:hypothetical protein FRC17_010119 [Serendipita sp. 399]